VTLNDQKSAFSEAWLRAVAAAAGFGVQGRSEPDDQSVDFTLTSRIRGSFSNPRLDVQLKCTADALGIGTDISFDLKQKNYDDLRDPVISVPIILVLVQVPPDPLRWLIAGDTRVELFRAAWWISLRGRPDSGNDSKTTIHIPQTQRFTPDVLREMMIRLGNGGLP
jgi:hypothetical protein